ncbi:hypothetical protein B0H13DRAFT_2668072 [Mycena leptocephala]|nr:hypothetical protein B0H13DRAFT_2668072 [Mycena leptocephala]
MPASDPTARPPRLRRRRMSALPLRAAPPRLPPCRPLPCPSKHWTYLERRLSLFESAEWASTALDMLRSIRADVHSHLPDLPSLDLSPALSLDFDYFEFDEFKEKLKSRLSDVKGLVSSSLDFDFFSRSPTSPPSPPASAPTFEFEFCRPSFYSSAPPVLRELLDAFLAKLPSLSSLPASISLPCASLSAVSLLDYAPDGQEEAAEEGPTPADALRRGDFGRKLIGYEDLPLEWRNNPWAVEGYRCVFFSSSLLVLFSLSSVSSGSLALAGRIPSTCRCFALRCSVSTRNTHIILGDSALSERRRIAVKAGLCLTAPLPDVRAASVRCAALPPLPLSLIVSGLSYSLRFLRCSPTSPTSCPLRIRRMGIDYMLHLYALPAAHLLSLVRYGAACTIAWSAAAPSTFSLHRFRAVYECILAFLPFPST